jgi:hypothetical protein
MVSSRIVATKRVRLVWCLAVGLLSVPSVPRLANAADVPFRISPRPEWVRDVPVPDAAAQPDAAREDLQELLVDQQDRFSPGTGSEQYRHYAFRLLSAAGVHDNSELELDFDPGFQKLAIHSVRIRRGGESIDVTRSSRTRVTSRQSDDDARLYDDGIVVHFLIPGTRVGDSIEYEYTRSGQNPALLGHYTASFLLARQVPVERAFQRILYGGRGELRTRTTRSGLEPVRGRLGDFDEWVWQQDHVAEIEVEDHLPLDYEPLPSLEVTDYASWRDVVSWALPLYAKPSTVTPEVEALLETWMRDADPGRRLASAVRFVQDEVRYLAIEVGPNSFEPHAPSQVLHDRFGDCKDKALLLVTLLRRLGIDAVPALVAAETEQVTPATLPSPGAFDHVIVRASLGGRPLFIDATRTLQRGGAERIRSTDFGYSLPLAPGVDALQKMPPAEAPTPEVDVSEVFRIDGKASASLEVVTNFTGDAAVSQRRHLVANSHEQVQRGYENFYAKRFPSLTVSKPFDRADEDAVNTITVTEHYAIAEFFEENARTLTAWSIRDHIGKPGVVKRKMPLAVEHPLNASHTIVVDWDDAEFALDPVVLEGPALRFERSVKRERSRIAITYRLQSRSDRVHPEDVAAHLGFIDQVWDATGYELTQEAASSTSGPYARRPLSPLPRWIWMVPLALGGAMGIARSLKARRRRRWLAKGQPARGETPATAIPIPSVDEARRITAAVPCECGSGEPSAFRDSVVRFGGASLSVVESVCARCSRRIARYFAVSDS